MVTLQIKDKYSELRATITSDGTIKSNGNTIAYVNDDGSAGDKNQIFLGDTNSGIIRNSSEKPIGTVETSNLIGNDIDNHIIATIYDIDNRIIATIKDSGELVNCQKKVVAWVVPFQKQYYKLVTAYLFFVDPALILPNYFSLVTGVTGKVFSSIKPLMLIIDKDNELRAKIMADGSVTDVDGHLHGFLNEDGSAGNDKEVFLGEITTNGHVINNTGLTIGLLEDPNMILKDMETKKTLGRVYPNGQLWDEFHQNCGKVDFFSEKKFRMIAGYLFFFDMKLIQAHGLSLVVKTLHPEVPTQQHVEEKDPCLPLPATPSITITSVPLSPGSTITSSTNNKHMESIQRQLLEAEMARAEAQQQQLEQEVMRTRCLLEEEAMRTREVELEKQKLEEECRLKAEEAERKRQIAEEEERKLEEERQFEEAERKRQITEMEKRKLEEAEIQAKLKIAAITKQQQQKILQVDHLSVRKNSEGLVNIVAPQPFQVITLYDYTHPDPYASEFFSFKAGEIFTIVPLERDLSGWKIALSANGKKGFVPGNYIRYLIEQEYCKDTTPVAVPVIKTSTNTRKARNSLKTEKLEKPEKDKKKKSIFGGKKKT